VATLIAFFDFVLCHDQFLQPFDLVMKDCKSTFLGVLPQAMFFLRLVDLVVSSEWFLRSLDLCVAMSFAGVPFPCCLSSVFFKLWWTANNQRKKTSIEIFNIILFY
jgi:hypothetical protein